MRLETGARNQDRVRRITLRVVEVDQPFHERGILAARQAHGFEDRDRARVVALADEDFGLGQRRSHRGDRLGIAGGCDGEQEECEGESSFHGGEN